jgi:acyl-CoA synthetase (AMP-forming)/AMP-acid ligase II
MLATLLFDSGAPGAPGAPERRPWLDGEDQATLEVHARRIAAAIGEVIAAAPGPRVVLSCKHARSYVPGLLGAWLAGATVELLPNVQPGTLDRVDADPAIACVLHDDPEHQGRSPKALYVPELITREATFVACALPVLAVRMTTSGTTERPRYVEKSLAQLVDEVSVLARLLPTPHCVLSTVPFSHLYGLLWGVLLPLRTGARIASHEALLPADVATAIEREQVDLLISTPAHLRAMAEAPMPGPMPGPMAEAPMSGSMPRALRVISSGARLPEALHASLIAKHGWHVTDVLGATETGGIATRSAPDAAWQPLPGVTVTAPAQQLVVESAWCTGKRIALDDRIELASEGTFSYLGRATELVKIAGKRADASALEATVRTVPGVTDAAVLVHTAPGKEPRIALAVTTAETGVSRDAVASAIRRDFDAVFVPKIFRVVAQLPRTDRGKLDPRGLRALLGIADSVPVPDSGSDPDPDPDSDSDPDPDSDSDSVPVPYPDPGQVNQIHQTNQTHHTNHAARVDEIPIERVGPGEYRAAVPADLVFFDGHFDTFKVLCGAAVIDRIVWPIVKLEHPEVGELRAIRRLRFKQPIRPAQTVAVKLVHTAGKIQFEVLDAAVQLASGNLVVT